MSVCLLPLSWLNGQTCGPDFWCVGQVEGYLGQVYRSRSHIKGQGHQVKKCFTGVFCLMELDGSMRLDGDEETGEASH